MSKAFSKPSLLLPMLPNKVGTPPWATCSLEPFVRDSEVLLHHLFLIWRRQAEITWEKEEGTYLDCLICDFQGRRKALLSAQKESVKSSDLWHKCNQCTMQAKSSHGLIFSSYPAVGPQTIQALKDLLKIKNKNLNS